ncbi:hypothetical protein [Tamaricihabitans halophyticus]|nr:hypothetical protein [Tamaricihabitans halophyticus]
MPKDPTRLRRKVVRISRRATHAYDSIEESNFARHNTALPRFTLAARRAQPLLFRTALSFPDDPAPRIAYGEFMSRYTQVLAHTGGHVAAQGSVRTARGALWAFNLPELNDLNPPQVQLVINGPPVETEFTSSEALAGIISGEARVAVAADVRVQLAAQLATVHAGPSDRCRTPEDIDSMLRTRSHPFSGDETEVWKCQLKSCHGLDPVAEARVLVAETTRIYQILADLGCDRAADNAAEIEDRCRTVLQRINGDDG